jgi:hypothetical protein
VCCCFFSPQQNHNISAFHLLSPTGGQHYHVVVEQLASAIPAPPGGCFSWCQLPYFEEMVDAYVDDVVMLDEN